MITDYKPTEREHEVLMALVTGTGTTLDVADRCGMAEGTVGVHLGQLMTKLERHTRVQLAVWYVLTGRYRFREGHRP